MSLKKKLASGALAAGLLVPATFAVASAQSSDPSTTAPSTSQPVAPAAGAPSAADRQARRESLVAEVAAKAGISTEKLQTAINEVRLEHLTTRLNKAVSNGRITQAQADEIIAKAKNGEWPGRNGLGLGGSGLGGFGLGGHRGGAIRGRVSSCYGFVTR